MTESPGLINDPSSSFSDVCWSLMLNKNRTCMECYFHRALTQHSKDFVLFPRAGNSKRQLFWHRVLMCLTLSSWVVLVQMVGKA